METGVESVNRESGCHMIGLKTPSLWVTLTSIPGLHKDLLLRCGDCMHLLWHTPPCHSAIDVQSVIRIIDFQNKLF